MSYTLPGWVDEILEFIGINFPNVDEDDYREMADALREFADDFDGKGGDAHAAITRVLSASEGWAKDSLEGHWSKVKKGHLEEVPKVAKAFADALDVIADIIFGMKRKAEVELGVMAASLGIAIGAAFVTGGLSALIGAAQTAAMRQTIKRIIDEAAERVVEEVVAKVTEPVTGKLGELVEDALLDLSEDALALPPGDGGGGGTPGVPGSGGHGSGMNLNSAGGSGATQLNSAGGGSGGKMRIDPDEYDGGATKLSGLGKDLESSAGRSLGRAKGAFGRTKGRDPFTQAVDAVFDGAIGACEKTVKRVGRYMDDGASRALKRMANNHRDNDRNLADAMKAIDPKSDAKGKPGIGGGGGNKRWDQARMRMKVASADLSQKARALWCKVTGGDPIDMATGEMLLAETDLSLPGVLPLLLGRTHLSSRSNGVFFGPAWVSLLDERLVRGDGGYWWHRQDGSSLAYHREPDLLGDEVFPEEGERSPLSCVLDGSRYAMAVADTRNGLTRHFEKLAGHASDTWWLTGLSDRNGNNLTLERDERGVPTAMVHDGGYHVDLTSENGLITEVSVRTGPDSSVTVCRYSYDEDRLTAVVDASGAPKRFAYDDELRITAWTNRLGSTYSYIYDETGRVVRTVGPDGFLSSTLEYDPRERTTKYTDSTGAVWQFRMNGLGQVIEESDPYGRTVFKEWDRHDNLLKRTDPLGHSGEFEWDERGNLVRLHRPDGLTAATSYTSLGLPEHVTGPDGTTWIYGYDSRGNCISVTAPDGAACRYEYDATGALAAFTDPVGATERRTNSPTGLCLTASDALGNTYSFEYNALGQPIVSTDPTGAVTRMEWSPDGRLLRQTAPDGAVERYEWDAEGHCIAHADSTGSTTHFEYTHFDLLAARTGADGARYEFIYDTELRPVQVRNPMGLTWEYTYNKAGDLVAETDFDGRTHSYTLDAAGRVTSHTPPTGETLTREYDAMGRLARKAGVDGTATDFTYDAAGRVLAVESAASVLAYERDILGRVISETVNGRTMRYTYGADGALLTRTTPTGAHSTFAYDPAGALTSLVAAGREMAWTRDEFGRETHRSHGHFRLDSAWDRRGRLTEQTVHRGLDLVASQAHTYRADGFPTATIDQFTGTEANFTLDEVGRPTAITGPDWSEAYAYDAIGNQISGHWPETLSRTEARGDREYEGNTLISAGAVRYEYDDAGRIVLRQKKRLSRKPDTWRYEWDAEDRLTACTTPDGTRWEYEYDPIGRRTSKHRIEATTGERAETVLFSWHESTLIEQVDGRTGVALTWEYEESRPIAQLERHLTADQQETDSRFFAIVTNLVGRPTRLVDAEGDTAWQASSTVWGATAWNRNATAYTPLRLPGQYEDPETGLYYNVHRHYDPETARYVSPDPYGLDPAPNPMAYVVNPLVQADPLGLRPASIGCGANGGWYGGLLPANKDKSGRPITPAQEVNHIPPKSAWKDVIADGFYRAGVPHKKQQVRYGPAVRMDKDDHGKLLSTGSSAAAQEWQRQQRDLVKNGYLDLAMQCDIDDVRAQFGTKYDGAIKEMIDSCKGNEPLKELVQQRGWQFDPSTLK